METYAIKERTMYVIFTAYLSNLAVNSIIPPVECGRVHFESVL